MSVGPLIHNPQFCHVLLQTQVSSVRSGPVRSVSVDAVVVSGVKLPVHMLFISLSVSQSAPEQQPTDICSLSD